MNKEVQVNIDDKKNFNKYFISINIFFMLIISSYLYGFIHISQETVKLSELIENGNRFFINTNDLITDNKKSLKLGIDSIIYNTYLFNETLIDFKKNTNILTFSTLRLLNNTNNKVNNIHSLSENKLQEVDILISNMDNTINKFNLILNQLNRSFIKEKEIINSATNNDKIINTNPQIPSPSTIGA